MLYFTASLISWAVCVAHCWCLTVELGFVLPRVMATIGFSGINLKGRGCRDSGWIGLEKYVQLQKAPAKAASALANKCFVIIRRDRLL